MIHMILSYSKNCGFVYLVYGHFVVQVFDFLMWSLFLYVNIRTLVLIVPYYSIMVFTVYS